MKNHFYTTLLFLLGLPFFCQATHNIAGEIIYEQTGTQSVQVSILTYTEASSTPADRPQLTIDWGDGSQEMLPRVNGPNAGGELLDNGIKYNVYTGVHTYTADGTYTVSMTDPNRNHGILNVNPPNSDNVLFYLESTFTLQTELNQSPILLLRPIDFALVNQPFLHTPNAFDPDGDSISYELIAPLESAGMDVPLYSYPNDIEPGANNELSIDAKTGLVRWDSPQLAGAYTIAILVREYRDGVQIGSAIRDMLIEVKDEEQDLPVVSSTCVDQTVEVGDMLNFTIDASIANSSALIKLHASGGPFVVDNNPASFSGATDFSTSPVSGQFQWKIEDNHPRQQPYQLVFKTLSTAGYVDMVVCLITVKDELTATPKPFPKLTLYTFPNPAQEDLYLQLEGLSDHSKIHITLSGTDGQVFIQETVFTNARKHQLDLKRLSSGIYSLQVQHASGTITEQIVIQR